MHPAIMKMKARATFSHKGSAKNQKCLTNKKRVTKQPRTEVVIAQVIIILISVNIIVTDSEYQDK